MISGAELKAIHDAAQGLRIAADHMRDGSAAAFLVATAVNVDGFAHKLARLTHHYELEQDDPVGLLLGSGAEPTTIAADSSSADSSSGRVAL